MSQLGGPSAPLLDTRDERLLILLAIVFAAGVLANMGLPGLFMDEVNPDYYAAMRLQGKAHPSWLLPTANSLPALGAAYHGIQHFYFGLPFFYVFGTTVESLRVFHALFGLGILGATYVLLRRLQTGRWVAFAATACLAVDPTFIYAFRTQIYITMAPMLWWMLGLLSMLGGTAGSPPSRLRLVASGALCGFAFYGYFIYLFIAPAVLAIAVASTPRDRFHAATFWCLGFLAGTLPYFYGYANWAASFSDFHAFLDALRQAFASARPEGSTSDVIETIRKVWATVTVAVTGEAVQLLMLSASTEGPKDWLMPVLLLVAIAAAIFPLDPSHQSIGHRAPGLAIVSFLVLSAWFIGRMWAHHFAILLPLLYIGCATLASRSALVLQRLLPRQATRRISLVLGAAAVVAMLALNVGQNATVQARLVATGGVNKFTDAINLVAQDALRQDRPLYVLHEWGFFMPIAFLASRNAEIATTFDDPAVAKQLCERRSVYSAYWIDAGVSERIEADRSRLGAHIESERVYRRRDGVDAIKVVQFARANGSPACGGRTPASS